LVWQLPLQKAKVPNIPKMFSSTLQLYRQREHSIRHCAGVVQWTSVQSQHSNPGGHRSVLQSTGHGSNQHKFWSDDL
jgi:hypothetical protein